LARQLARESAESAFTKSGALRREIAAESPLIVPGEKIRTQDVIRALTADGGKITDWGKYSTRIFQGPSGDFQVHFYMNRSTGAISYLYDHKVKFN
jgi:hypothetical protein